MFLEGMGAVVSRRDLRDTPRLVARAWSEELLAGYRSGKGPRLKPLAEPPPDALVVVREVPPLGYLALKDMLGDATFGHALHEYMNRWHGKHPIPWDFFNTFNNVTGQNLNWFWNAWYFGDGYIDLAVAGVDKTGDGYTARVNNIGGIPVPFDLEARFSDAG